MPPEERDALLRVRACTRSGSPGVTAGCCVPLASMPARTGADVCRNTGACGSS
ncbi:hypothetical protein ASZ90_010580 [hydrocarbon metagenome]|uniref:Uncharacterized protein n=1 Tax=hydrocarbon metagenome TaxID=938273 RepID=A0A0W8FFR1_9ZZZZ